MASSKTTYRFIAERMFERPIDRDVYAVKLYGGSFVDDTAAR
jgi:hypothetical protein